MQPSPEVLAMGPLLVRRALTGPLLSAMLLLAGCGAGPQLVPTRVDAAEGYSLLLPGPVESRSGRDGKAAFRIDFARTADGARFEVAWFGFPEPLGPPERAELLAQVERGLAGERGTQVVSRTAAKAGGREAIDLVLERADGKRGFHRILYLSAEAMLQVSAVGPPDGEWEREVPRFLASLVHRAEAPTPPLTDRPAGRAGARSQ